MKNHLSVDRRAPFRRDPFSFFLKPEKNKNEVLQLNFFREFHVSMSRTLGLITGGGRFLLLGGWGGPERPLALNLSAFSGRKLRREGGEGATAVTTTTTTTTTTATPISQLEAEQEIFPLGSELEHCGCYCRRKSPCILESFRKKLERCEIVFFLPYDT